MTKSEKNGLIIEYMRGTGPGGQHKNKVESACRITDKETGIQAYADCRSRETSYRTAFRELQKRIKEAKEQAKADAKKQRRDEVIHDHTVVRTYHFGRGTVKDHRTGKEAPIKQVIDKGRLDLLR